MNLLRINLEKRILDILKYINHPITSKLQENIGLFSIKELNQILSYLETGSLNPIYTFFEDKRNEYLDIINNLKIQKRYAKLNNIKLNEKLELEKEQKDLELIDFNF